MTIAAVTQSGMSAISATISATPVSSAVRKMNM
jgi:hypothetical protein